MKPTKKQSRRPLLSLRYKLSIYFILFSVIMLVFLWIFQTAFLETCYTLIKQNQIKSCASMITESIKSGEGTLQIINSVSRKNEMSVYVYDSTSAIMTEQYTSDFNNPSGRSEMDMHKIYAFHKLARDNGGKYITISSLENSFAEKWSIQAEDIATADEKPENKTLFGLKMHRVRRVENMIYAEILKLDDETECFVLMNAMITPVGTVTTTLRVQLIIVSVVFIVFAFILALIVSKRISRPIGEINESVKELAVQNYDVEFNSSGYREVQELSDTLNLTRKELSKVEDLRQELIANVSHDLRTPLTMITGYGEVMRDLPGENTPENVQVIIDEANRLTTLVNDMLDLSKLQSGAIEIQREDFSLTDSVKDIFKRYSKLVEQEGYNISFTADKNAFVCADRVKIGQVVYNFVNNAVNHCGEDKTVIVTQKVSSERVRVEVTDHGEGIEPDKLEYIWDRYYKVDKDHKRGVIGTGLGLSIVKRILDLHGARYGVKSKPGVGSTFWFELECKYTEPI